ncbi:hypothetical protein [Haloarchaeobius sp. HME9146]|uniref:DUF7550 family protein n=1 Tax=unclassified Haloarchaeobius TaxID=2614452 RepID=UPI0021BE669D|nr:hypothetical protein [Haloarchaeobius sp. HME9146]MCT9096213.1 hypothetical protein [Haloarchaeobius sp. HME9146]
MSDETEDVEHADHDHDDHHDHGDEDGRVTSPMQEFGASAAGIGFVTMLVGILLTMAVPLLLV